MRLVKLRMTLREFRQLPRHPAYKYEYIDGEAWLSPRPRTYHALLDLRPPPEGDDRVTTRPVADKDWTDLVRLFSAAFKDHPPFLGLDDRKHRSAARAILEHARSGGDGPFVEHASFLATADPRDGPAGGILITLLPASDLADWRSFAWPEPPPAERRRARPGPAAPHLDLRSSACRGSGRRHGPAARRDAAAPRPRLHRIGQHIPARQRVEHALALAQRLPADRVAVVAAANVGCG